MKTPVLSLTEIYTQWLASIKAIIPGGTPAAPKELNPKEALTAAKQEWEDEGGRVKP